MPAFITESWLREHFSLAPLRSEPEGSRITLPEGFDAAAVRVTGNVVGKAMARGGKPVEGFGVPAIWDPEDGECHLALTKDQQQIVYEVQVYRVFKGQRVAERIEMASAADSAACGLETQVGERRIWYLDQGYRANLCSNLSAPKLPDSIPDATNLPKGTPPVTLPAEAAPTESLVPARWGLGLIGLGLAVTGLVWLRARRRPVS